jgi:hypothetical protein
MVAGLSANDFANRGEAIASTCWASDARISRSKRLAALVWIDVIRRDPLAATKPLGSELMPTARRFGRLSTADAAPATARTGPLVEQFTPSTAPVIDIKPDPSPATRTPNRAATADNGPTVMRNGEDLSDYV